MAKICRSGVSLKCRRRLNRLRFRCAPPPMAFRFVASALLLTTTLVCLVGGMSASSAAPPPSMSPSVLSNLRKAMALTTRSNDAGDVAAAREAEEVWDALLPPTNPCLSSEAGRGAEADPPPTPRLPDGVLALSHALRASALSRLGRDSDAVSSYSVVLDDPALRRHLNAESFRDASLGRGDALQRLMRYREAARAFRECAESTLRGDGGDDVSASDRSICRAATCLLRAVGDDDGEEHARVQALNLLRDHARRRGWSLDADDVSEEWEEEAAGMMGSLLWLTAEVDADALALALLRHASRGGSLLYSWMYEVASSARTGRQTEKSSTQLTQHPALQDVILDDDDDESLLRLASVNQSPFDEPLLVHLDDKVLLHRLLNMPVSGDAPSSRPAYFFPVGFVLPDEGPSFRKYISSSTDLSATNDSRAAWILKERAGYGGHGCRVFSTTGALRRCADMEEERGKSPHSDRDSVLCQRLIDPPLLIDGRKFSLRVYVVYCPRGAGGRCADDEAEVIVFLSEEGLAKLAMVPYDASATPGGEDSADADADAGFISDAYMTNSGRGDAARQYTFAQLREELISSGALAGEEEWDGVWSDIKEAVRATMGRYHALTCASRASRESKSRSPRIAAVPKIMGFDFLLSSSPGSGGVKPFLLEVNRFPGLEPRSEEDAYVKRRVVAEAWSWARRVAGFDGNSEKDEGMWLQPLRVL